MITIHEIVSNFNFNGEIEELIYSPSYNDMTIECIDFVPGETSVKDAIDYATIEIFDKGENGTEYNLIAMIDNEDIEGGVDFVKNIKLSVNLSMPIVISNSITIRKVDNAESVNLGKSLIILRLREV